MTRFQTSLLLLVLTGSLATAQEERRTGTIGEAAPPRPLIASVNELEALDLLPEGYSYVFTAKVEGKTHRVIRMRLRSPDEKTLLSFERIEGTFAVTRRPLPSAKLLLQRGATQYQLERNRGSKLDRYLDEAVYAEGPGNFVIRGWSITQTTGDRKKRSILLDGIEVKVERKGLDQAWAERVYDKGQTVLIESTHGVQFGVRRKFVEVNRPLTRPIWIPKFHGQPDEVLLRGVVGAEKRAPKSIKNFSELRSHNVFRYGYAYTLDGATEGGRFVVRKIALESPERDRRLSLSRFEGVFKVRKSASGHLVASHEGVERTIKRNPALKLDRYLEQALQAGGPGEFKLRGWTITTRDASGQTDAALLDGVEVKVEREGLSGVWAERVYDKGKTVLLESSGRVQRGLKSRFVEVVRRTPRAGLTSALSR